MLLHRNVVANVLQIDEWLTPVLQNEAKVDRLTVMAALPLYHIFALTACFLLSVRMAAEASSSPTRVIFPASFKEA
jgi:long-chain acyl-CoA synthetase